MYTTFQTNKDFLCLLRFLVLFPRLERQILLKIQVMRKKFAFVEKYIEAVKTFFCCSRVFIKNNIWCTFFRPLYTSANPLLEFSEHVYLDPGHALVVSKWRIKTSRHISPKPLA